MNYTKYDWKFYVMENEQGIFKTAYAENVSQCEQLLIKLFGTAEGFTIDEYASERDYLNNL